MIRAGTCLPELSHIVESGQVPVFVTLEGRIGALFECPLLDLESLEADNRISGIERLIAALPEGYIARVIQRAVTSSSLNFESFRTEAIERLGFVNRRILLSVEKSGADPISLRSLLRVVRGKSSALSAEIDTFLRGLPHHELAELSARALSSSEVREELEPPRAQVAMSGDLLDFGSELIGVVRVFKPGARKIGENTLAMLLDQIPMPFEVSATVRKVPRHRADFRLRSQLTRGQILQDPTNAAKQEATEKALTETALYGAALCEIEWLLCLSRTDEATLRGDLEKARSILGGFGDAMIETIGVVPSYIASRVGARPHFTFLEEDGIAPLYLPVFGYGESVISDREWPRRTLLLHRLDGSLHRYNHFSLRFLAYNALICGKTGSGKSVLANALSSALMQDPDIRMIKIDVGGSYKKECEAFSGEKVDFRLDAPSGVNPFRVFLNVSASNEAVEIVAEFLATLIREEGEAQIPKGMRAQVEECLKAYAAVIRKGPNKGQNTGQNTVAPNIDAFLATAAAFPRKNLLARWATGGVFENALKERTTGGEKTGKYRYFNFENIQAAASRDFAEGVMAAVITMVNLEMLRLGDRSKGQAGERLVLFCDETRFFIERFAQFFLLTAANFRKFGHGLILMLQNIRDAEIRLPDGKHDSGLILNSPIRFFLQADTEAEYLKKQFQFDEHHLRVVVTHPYRGREYREAVLQDDTGTRVVRLYLTDEEYWRMTSTKEDVDKFNKLRLAVPELDVEEAIRCLAVAFRR